jgi:hypothetical protein
MTKLSAAWLLLMVSVIARAQDERDAVIAALRNWGSVGQVEARQVEFAVTPSCEGGKESWRVKGARFDATLRAWVVETSCAGSGVPFLAIVHVNDPDWLRVENAVRRKIPILVRAGERRQLVVEFAGGRIVEPVVCLRSGRAGDVIRVRSLDRKAMHRVLVSETGELVLVDRQ